MISIIFIIIKSNNLDEDQIHVPFQKRDLSKMSEYSSFQFLDMRQLEHVCQNVTGKEKKNSERLTVSNLSVLCVKVNNN